MVLNNVYRMQRTQVRWFWALFLLDLGGLALAAVLASRRVPFPQGQMLVTLSLTLGLTYWFALRPRTWLPPYDRYLVALLCPALASATTVAVLGALRSYYSGMYLAQFTIIWALVMLVARGLTMLLQPPPRVLLVGNSGFWRELEANARIRATRLLDPPERVTSWDVVVLDPSAVYSPEWLSWLAHADMRGVPVISAPIMIENLSGKIAVEALDGRWATDVFRGATDYKIGKRALDLLAVVILAPVLLLLGAAVALLVLLDGGRPVLFWQDRIGKDGQVFRMVKFRTMYSDAEKDGAAFASHGDRRVTRMGAFLRRFRLDELPQFWNVLRGDMSVVGPRPEQEVFVREFDRTIPLYGLRHTVQPGITGWAQVNHGYAASASETREKMRYDIFYVKHLSFWLDLQIVLLTLRTILTGFGSR